MNPGGVRSPLSIDSWGLWPATLRAPHHALAALESRGPDLLRPRFVMVSGQMIDASGADLLETIAASTATVPVTRLRSSSLPAHFGPGWLLVQLCSSGPHPVVGRLADQANAVGGQCVVVATVPMAGIEAQVLVGSDRVKRAGYLAAVAAGAALLDELGVLPGARAHWRTALACLVARIDALAAGEAPKLAAQIGRRFPFIVGRDLSAVAAWHWQRQINLCVKTPALAATMDELEGGGLAAFGQHGDITRQLLALFGLGLDGTARARVDNWLDEVVGSVTYLNPDGPDELSVALELMFTGDLVALVLAGREELDPGPVPALEQD